MVSGVAPSQPDPDHDAVMDDDIEVVVYENHPSLYFDDGNTIFSCASTLFCVHPSVVSKHSVEPVNARALASSRSRSRRTSETRSRCGSKFSSGRS